MTCNDQPMQTPGSPPQQLSELLIARSGEELGRHDTRDTPGFTDGKEAAKARMPDLADEVAALQERLYAEADGGGTRSLLLVVQGMDTSGKGGIMRHVVGACDPQGVRLTAFKAPTKEERSHPFLWRIRKALPQPGEIGVFDRSHYEDVLIVRVRNLVPPERWRRRYAQINDFEQQVADSGTTIVKVMLNISPQEQYERLAERLARPDKYWKYNPADIDERLLWPAYQEAYEAAIEKCSTDTAPWFVVPADRKWYARYAVLTLLREHLEAMDPQWPSANYEISTEQARLEATKDVGQT
jgi:PPK2 family polyphosphate:nucleotide phosphotransferase